MQKDFLPPLPTGISERKMFFRAVWFCLFGGSFPFGNTDTVTIEFSGGKYYFNARTSNARSLNRVHRWPTKIVANPDVGYTDGQVIFVAPSSALATTGFRDATADPTGVGPLILVPPGTWVAVRDVPAQTTVATGPGTGRTVWNGPQWPLPTADDPDADNVYWYFLSAYPSCVN